MRYPRRQFPHARQRGSVIVLVLVLVILMTFIVTAFLEEATSKIKYYGLFHNRDDLRVDAYSAMEIALARISLFRDIEEALWGPPQGWDTPLEDFGFQPAHASRVEITFEDESARLPLADLEYGTLLVLFDVLGFDLPEAESLADGLLDWTDEDDLRRLNGFDGEDDYDDQEPPYRPANAPIQAWDEFRLIKPFNTIFWDEEGRPDPRWNQFKEAVSLYHSGPVNLNQANATVLAVLEEQGLVDSRAFHTYKSGVDGTMGTEDDRLIRSAETGAIIRESGVVGTEVQLLRVKATAIRGEARFELEYLVEWSGANPGAGNSAESRSTDRTREARNTDPNTAADQRRRARGSARTAPTVAADLGYPFRFVRIAENRKI